MLSTARKTKEIQNLADGWLSRPGDSALEAELCVSCQQLDGLWVNESGGLGRPLALEIKEGISAPR